ncbi:MAG: hypothetical protein AAFQ95_12790 [Cyanobacteria bacterium J06621_3]
MPENAILIQTINLFNLSPASPDPAGITYVSTSGRLLVSDSEVNETALFTGDNLFETSLSGSLINTDSTISFSNEPTGITFNPNNGHYFITDDDRDRVFELNSQLQVINEFSTRVFNSFDPEGITYADGLGTLFIAGGSSSTIYQTTTSGALISSFDIASSGFRDPEGIVYDPERGTLFVVGENDANYNPYLAEFTTTGAVVNTYDVSAVNPVKLAGLTLAPNSQDPTKTSIYIADRGIDNNADPNENDGKIYEFDIGLTGVSNQAPVVNAGADQFLTSLTAISLDGTLADDGLPNPSGMLTSTWSQISGPGTATFGNASSEDTTVDFSTFGTYVLQLEATDGELTTTDQVQITVSNPNLSEFIYISTKTDGTVDGIAYADEDILLYDITTETWSQFFDGSDVGLGANGTDISAFHLNTDGSILLSLTKDMTVAGLGLVDDSDILRFVPTSTGTTTAGTFEMYFDGSDVGLTGSAEDIDAFGFTPDGLLVISTKGSHTVDSITGMDSIVGKDEDLILFNETSFGENTSGTWAHYFDGSDVGLSDGGGEDVNAMSIDANGDIYLSTNGSFNAPGVSGDGADVITFSPNSLGSNTSGVFSSFFDGSSNGLAGEVIDSFMLA